MAGYNNQCSTCKYESNCAGAHGNKPCPGHTNKDKKGVKR